MFLPATIGAFAMLNMLTRSNKTLEQPRRSES